MNKEQYLIGLIYNALKNSDNHTRQQAEIQLVATRDSNPQEFFVKCAQMISSSEMDEFIRISCATIISRSLTSDQGKQGLWDKVSVQQKDKIKHCLMSTLIQKNMAIMRAVAHSISCIAAIQLVRNQWVNLCDLLAETTVNSDPTIRNASVTTIGYTCQQLRSTKASLNSRILEQFLGGIVSCSDDQIPDIQKTALIALKNSMQLIVPLLNNQQIRQRIFSIMLAGISNPDMAQQAYLAFYQFAKFAHEYLGEYMNTICGFIINNLHSKNQLSILGLQLIDTIGTQFLQRLQTNESRINAKNQHINPNNYLIGYQNDLLPEIMRCFLIETPDDLNNSEFRSSAMKALGSMAACGNPETLDIIVNGVNTMLNSNNPGFEQASAPLLSAICEYPNQQAARNSITKNIEPVLTLLNSNELIVVSNSINGFSVIAEYFPEIFYHHRFIKDIIDKLFQLYHDSKQHQQHSQVNFSILIFFKNLSEGFNKQQSNILLSDPNLMIKPIVSQYEAAINDKQQNKFVKTEQLTSILLNCLHGLNINESLGVLNDVIQFLMDRFYYFFNMGNKKYERIINNILCILQISLYSLSESHGRRNHQLMEHLCELLDVYIKREGIQEGGLHLISALSLGFSGMFYQKVALYWPYIFDALRMVHHPEILKAALETIGDLSRSYMQQYQEQFNSCMRHLFSLINEQIQKNIKIKIIQAIGDLFLSLGKSGEQYTDNLLTLFDVIFDAINQLSRFPEQKQYIENLQQVIVETFSSAVFSFFTVSYAEMISNEKYEKFSNHYDKIIQFVKFTCQKTQSPKVEYVKYCLEFVNDLTGFLIQYEKRRTRILQTFEDQEIRQLVSLLDKFSIRDDIRQLQETIRSQMY